MLQLISEKKKNGRYYTPDIIARALVEWAVTDKETKVFDPSFGKCAFLNQAAEVLSMRGAELPGRRIYGVDIDPEARHYLCFLLNKGAIEQNYIIKDFHAVRPEKMSGAPFMAIVGNPPYVRHHYISRELMETARTAIEEDGFEISKKASYWSYFVLHSLGFLAPNGKLAMVLPGSFLNSDYSAEVRKILQRHFERIIILLIAERIFPDAEEETILLLCENYGRPNQVDKLGTIKSSEELRTGIYNILQNNNLVKINCVDRKLLQNLVDWETLSLYNTLIKNNRVSQLKDWAKVRIGVVTGANHYFIMNKEQQKNWHIPDEFFQPIISRSYDLISMAFRKSDLHHLTSNGKKCLLLCTGSQNNLPKALEGYIAEGELKRIPNRHKCRTRDPWHAVPDISVPDAFLSYMSSFSPKIVLNMTNATCTNAIHRLIWLKRMSKKETKSVALAALSSLTKLSAELVGRYYGGGVLKLEPKEALRLILPVPEPSSDLKYVFGDVNRLLIEGKSLEANKMVDNFVLGENLGFGDREIKSLHKAWLSLVQRRIGHKIRFGEK